MMNEKLTWHTQNTKIGLNCTLQSKINPNEHQNIQRDHKDYIDPLNIKIS